MEQAIFEVEVEAEQPWHLEMSEQLLALADRFADYWLKRTYTTPEFKRHCETVIDYIRTSADLCAQNRTKDAAKLIDTLFTIQDERGSWQVVNEMIHVISNDLHGSHGGCQCVLDNQSCPYCRTAYTFGWY